jgi:hypothetical protein
LFGFDYKRLLKQRAELHELFNVSAYQFKLDFGKPLLFIAFYKKARIMAELEYQALVNTKLRGIARKLDPGKLASPGYKYCFKNIARRARVYKKRNAGG